MSRGSIVYELTDDKSDAGSASNTWSSKMALQNLSDQPALLQAIFHKETDIARNLILNGENVNWRDGEGRSPLHAAAYMGNADIADALILSGARSNVKDNQWRTPLHRACRSGRDDMVEVLLKHGADVFPTDRQWQTPLHVCAAFDAVQCAQYLLALSTEGLDKGDRLGRAPLHHAAFSGHIEMVELLMSKGANLDARDKRERRPMHWAAFAGHWDVVRTLVLNGADPTAKDKEGLTPLHCASASGQMPTASYLLSAEVMGLWPTLDPNAPTLQGHTPLHFAANNGKDKVAQLLVTFGGAIDSTSNDGMTPLHLAVGSTDGTACSETLIASGADVSAQADDGRTPLHMGAEYGRFARVQLLLAKGAQIDAPDERGASALHVAARFGHILLIKKLIQNNANVNRPGPRGLTPLHIAAQLGYLDPVRTLTEAGANLSMVDDDGRTSLHLAAYSNNPSADVVQYLLSAGVDHSRKDHFKRLALHYAAFRANEDHVMALVKAGSDPNAADVNGHTPLHFAASTDHEGRCVEALSRAGANFDSRETDGFLPVHMAAYAGNIYTVELLLDIASPVQVPTSGHPLHLSLHHIAAARGFDDLLIKLLTRFIAQIKNLDQRPHSNLFKRVGMETDFKGRIPLHMACAKGHAKCVSHLIQPPRGVDAMLTADRRGVTPFHMAAAFGQKACLRLVPKKAFVDAKYHVVDHRKRTALMFAVSSGDADCVNFLMESQGNEQLVRQRDYKSRTCLHRAAAVGAVALCKQLIEQLGAQPLDRDEQNGWTALHFAAASNRVEAVQYLLQVMADIGQKSTADNKSQLSDRRGLSPVHWAAYRGHEACLSLLLDHPHLCDLGSSKFTPLHCAAEAGRLVCAQLLLKRHGPALVAAQDFRGRTALHLAAAKDSEALVQALLEAGAPIDAVDYQHRTPLITAVAGRANARIIDLLLQKGASIWPADTLGNTALHHACIEKLDDVGCLLVKRAPPPSPLHGGNRLFVDLQNERLQTALHLAIPAGMFETVSQILTVSQASLTMLDDSDRIPLLAGAESDDVADCMQIALSLMVPDAPPPQSSRLSERMSLCSAAAGHTRPSLASGHRKMSTYSGSDTELY